MTDASPIIRDARADDAPAIAKIYAHEVLNGVATFEEIPPGADEMAARMAKLATAGFPYFVAEADGRLVGYAYGSPWHERSAYRLTVQDSVYVDAAFHRRGLGRLMLARLIERCQTRGFRQMLAAVGGPNPGSIALHEALGFRLIGTAEAIGLKFGRWLDVAYLQRAL